MTNMKNHHYTWMSVATWRYAVTDSQEKTPQQTATCGHLAVCSHRLTGKNTTTNCYLWPPGGMQSQTHRKKHHNKLLPVATWRYAVTDSQEKTPQQTATCGHLAVCSHRLTGKNTTTNCYLWPPGGMQSQTHRKNTTTNCYLWPPGGMQSQTHRKKHHNKLLPVATWRYAVTDSQEKTPQQTATCGHLAVCSHRLTGKNTTTNCYLWPPGGMQSQTHRKKHHNKLLSVATWRYAVTDSQEKTPQQTATCGHLAVCSHRLTGKNTTTNCYLWPPGGMQSQTHRKKHHNKLLSVATWRYAVTDSQEKTPQQTAICGHLAVCSHRLTGKNTTTNCYLWPPKLTTQSW